MQRPSWAPEGIDIDRPSGARMYDYLLGGSHNFEVDRQLVERVLTFMPDLAQHGWANRAFMRRAVGFCLGAGIHQFLDIGSGIPTRGSVHEVVQLVAPQARVAYVDVDPVAVAHSREILAGNDLAVVVQADVRQPERVLGSPQVRDLLDFDQPMAVLMVGLLHFVLEDPSGIVAALRDAVVPGSYLAISHLSQESRPGQMAESIGTAKRGGMEMVPRSRSEVQRFFAGLELVEPGVVWTHEWRPDPAGSADGELGRPVILCGLGRKV